MSRFGSNCGARVSSCPDIIFSLDATKIILDDIINIINNIIIIIIIIIFNH